METKYDLKRLTFLGMVYAVLFTVFMLSSFKAQAQSVSISGPASVCLDPTAVAQYNATVTGVTSPTYSWSYANNFGDAQSAGGTLGVFGVEWHTQTCGTGTPTTTTNTFAWVTVDVAEAAAPGVVVASSAPFFVNISKPLGTYAPAFIGTPYSVCKTTTTKTVTVNALPEGNCNAVGLMTVTGGPLGGLATPTFSGVSGTNLNYSVQHNGTVGTYTLTYEVTSGACGSVSTTTTFAVLDTPAPITLGVLPSSPICFNSGDYTFTSTIVPGIITWSWTLNGGSVGSNTNVYTYASPAVGTHTVVVTAQHLCGNVSDTEIVVVHQLPALPSVSVTNPAIYGESVTLTAGTTPLTGASYAFTIVTNSIATPTFTLTPPAVGVNSSTFTAFAIGVHSYTGTVTSTLGCVNTKTGTFTVSGPIYAKFNDPSYSTTGTVVTNNFNGDILPYVPDVPVKPALGFSFWKYNETPYTPTGLNATLSQGNIGDYYRLSKWNGTAWVIVTGHTSNYNGTNSVSLGNLELETDTYYKLHFENIFRQTADGGGTLKRVLFKTNGVFNEKNVDAYEMYNYASPPATPYDAPHVIFKTTSLPIVYPTDVTAICDDYTITFVNPVKYRVDGAISTTATLNHKFFLQQADAGTGPWVEVPFKATPSEFKNILGASLPNGTPNDGTYGPTKITFQQTENGQVINFLNNKFYRVVIAGISDGYGFIDMKLSAGVVTPVYVLATATQTGTTTIQGQTYTYNIDFPRQGGFGWEWNTQIGAAYVLQIFNNPTGVSPVYAVSAGDLFNKIQASGLPGVGTVTNTTATVNINTASPTFTLTATAREGYTFKGWEKGGVLIAGSVNTPTYTFDPAQGVTCGAATSTFAAKYELNKYIVNYEKEALKASFVTIPQTLAVSTATSTLDHGTTFSIEVTPNTGYAVTGFTDNFGMITGGLVTKTFASNLFAGTRAATYQRRLIGTPYSTTQVYTVTPTYTEFNPYIYAVAVASPTMTVGVASVTITTEFQILQSGINSTPFTGATPANAFSWSQVKSGAKVTLVAGIANDCQLEFKYWMRGTPATPSATPNPEWVIVTTGNGVVVNGSTLEITSATLNHAYRAVYGKKTVNLVALAETADMGTVVVEYFNPSGVKTESINNVPPVSLIVGSTVTLTVYPKPDYYTYSWYNTNDVDELEDVIFFDRMPDYRYSRWTYVVGECDPTTTIVPDIDLVRNELKAKTYADGNEYIGGTFTVASSGPAYDESEWKYATNAPGLPTWVKGSGTGFKFNKTTLLKQTQTGSSTALYNPILGIATNTFTAANFEKGTSFTLAASANTNYSFVKWERLVNSIYVTVPDAGSVLTGFADAPEEYRAVFTLNVPTGDLVVDSYLPGAIQIDESLSTLHANVTGYSTESFMGSSIDEEIKVPQSVGLTTNTVTVSAPTSVKDGYVFDYWVVNGTTVTSTTVTRPMTENGLTVKAVFKQQVYTLSVQSRGYRYAAGATSPDQFQIVNHGGTVSGPATAIGGQNVTFNATVNAGWEFVNWMIGSVGSGEILTGYQLGQAGVPSLTINMPYLPSGQATATVYAIYRELGSSTPFPKYTLVTNSDPVGFATTGNDGTYVHSVIVPIFADDNPSSAGYAMSHWEQRSAAGILINGNYTSGTVNFNNTAVTGYIMTAVYEPIEYQLVAYNTYPSFGTVQVGNVSSTTMVSKPYDILDNPIYVKATANGNATHYNYQFDSWKYANGDPVVDALGNDVAAEFYFIPAVPASGLTVDIYAHFSQVTNTYTVTLNNKLDGNNVPAAGKVFIDGVEKTPGTAYTFGPNTPVVIKAQKNEGYVFKRWEKAGVTLITLPEFNHTVVETVIFDAVYELDSYDLTAGVNNAALGTVTPVTGTYNYTAPVTVTATEGIGNEFTGWTATGVTTPTANPAVFNMPNSDVNLVANFAKINYNVITSVAGGIGGTVNNPTPVRNYGDPVAVTAIPATGYHFDGWSTVQGINVNVMSPALSFTMPAGTVTLVASFAKTSYALNVTSVPSNGGSTSVVTANYFMGDAVTVTATNNAGFVFDGWTGTNIPAGTVTTTAAISFAMPANAVTLQANFKSEGNKLMGFVRYFNQFESGLPLSAGIKVALLDANNNPIGTPVSVGMDGSYEFLNIVPGTAYKVKVWETGTTLANTWSWNNWGGVSAADALVISYMASTQPVSFPWVGTSPYNAFILEVADVDNNSDITGNDAGIVMRRSIGLPGYSPFPIGGAPNFQVAGGEPRPSDEMVFPDFPSVVFAPMGTYAAGTAGTDFYYVGAVTGKAGVTNMNIYYLAGGDVNASYVPQGGAKAQPSMSYNGVINANVGDVVSIPVTIDQNVDFNAMNMSMTFNNNMIEVLSISNYDVVNVDNSNGTLNVAWFDAAGRNSSDATLVVNARILSDITATDRLFELNGLNEISDANAQVIEGVSFTAGAVNTTATNINEYSDLTANSYPNPFTNEATISYTMPEAGKVNVIVYNKLGQVVKVLVNEIQNAGVQTVRLNSSDLNGNGTYLYKILVEGSAKSYTVNGTLILVK